MKKRLFGALVLALTMLVPATAQAAKPEVIEDATFEVVDVIPGAFNPCGFDLTLTETVDVRVTVFTAKDGTETIRTHVTGKNTWSANGNELFERWHVNETIRPAEGTIVVAGNRWNAHGGAGGNVLNSSGRIVIDMMTGEIVSVAGPAEFEFGGGSFCEALAP